MAETTPSAGISEFVRPLRLFAGRVTRVTRVTRVPGETDGRRRAPRHISRPTRSTWASALTALLLSLVLIWRPEADLGFRSASLRSMIDVTSPLIVLLGGALVSGRFVRRGRLQDLLLGQGLLLLSMSELGSDWLLGGAPSGQAGSVGAWGFLILLLLASLLIAASGMAGARPAERCVPRRLRVLLGSAVAATHGRLAILRAPRRLSVIAPPIVAAIVFFSLWNSRSWLPLTGGGGGSSPDAAAPLLPGHPLFGSGQIVSALCFLIAATAFACQSAHRDDVLLRFLGPACVLGAFAHLHHALVPPQFTDRVSAGDILLAGSYLLLMVGAALHTQQYWHAQPAAAVLADRRRLARELHDGVLQELAYIRAESRAFMADDDAGKRIAQACERALDEARSCVYVLSHASTQPLSVVLRRAVGELAERHTFEFTADLDETISVTPEQQHSLVRIAREAISNSAHHGRAGMIRLSLSTSGTRRQLSIEDDGPGFDVCATLESPVGHGLIGMRERARALPGSLDVRSHIGRGSAVTVQW